MSKSDSYDENFKLKILKWLSKHGIKNLSLSFDSSLRETYKKVIKCYTNRDYYLQSKKTIQRPKYNKNIVLEIIDYVLKTDKSLFTSLNDNDRAFLLKYQDNNMTDRDINNWLNVYGDNLLDNVYKVLELDVLPSNFKNRIFDNSLLSKYTSLSALQDIETNITKSHQYILGYKNSEGELKETSVNINTNPKYNYSKATEDKIMRTILMLRRLNEKKLSDASMSVNIYLSEAKKKFDTSSMKILGSNNINSGVTVFMYDKSVPIITTVYRSEEMYKVLIHELVHNFKYDFAFADLHLKISDFLNISPNTKLTPNESYTEVVALILHTMIESYIFDNKCNFDLFKLMLEYETQFSLFQCAKILHFYGFKNTDDFFQRYDNLNRFKQNTNVFSYFFAKTSLLMNLGELLKFFNKYTSNFMLDRDNIQITKPIFEQLIISSLKKNNLKVGIDHYFKKMGHKDTSGFPKLLTTLKMTLFA
jgi:hypothetical protein